jgi:hypothetical protein
MKPHPSSFHFIFAYWISFSWDLSAVDEALEAMAAAGEIVSI